MTEEGGGEEPVGALAGGNEIPPLGLAQLRDLVPREHADAQGRHVRQVAHLGNKRY